jgi:hypothetical protein
MQGFERNPPIHRSNQFLLLASFIHSFIHSFMPRDTILLSMCTICTIHKNMQVVGGGRCPIVDTWWQTETGAIAIAPLPIKVGWAVCLLVCVSACLSVCLSDLSVCRSVVRPACHWRRGHGNMHMYIYIYICVCVCSSIPSPRQSGRAACRSNAPHPIPHPTHPRKNPNTGLGAKAWLGFFTIPRHRARASRHGRCVRRPPLFFALCPSFFSKVFKMCVCAGRGGGGGRALCAGAQCAMRGRVYVYRSHRRLVGMPPKRGNPDTSIQIGRPRFSIPHTNHQPNPTQPKIPQNHPNALPSHHHHITTKHQPHSQPGKEIEGPAEGLLAIKSPWPSAIRSIHGDHARMEETYFSYPGASFCV